nr:MAG TPA: hypothetical protein [Caudoviricetes sp.]
MNRSPTLNPQIPRKSELFYKPKSHMRLWLYIFFSIVHKKGHYSERYYHQRTKISRKKFPYDSHRHGGGGCDRNCCHGVTRYHSGK